MFAVQSLENCLRDLENVKENINPKQAPGIKKRMDNAIKGANIARDALQKAGGVWPKAARVNHAVNQELREAQTPSLTQEECLETLQQYKDGDSSGKDTSPVPIDIEQQAGVSRRGPPARTDCAHSM